jgi:2-polyprenyl-3-methyl-5-hydroxy-6-metoxy-1,4-benzoquinol methylase
MDIDRGFPHDYYSLDEINEQFDLITLLEVIEHLELEAGVEMLGRLMELLVQGGKLIISTPNIFHPNRFWQNVTHKVAYSYEELGGIVLSKGFDVVGIYRTFNASFLKYLLRIILFYPLHRILNVDFAKSIVILAQRKG